MKYIIEDYGDRLRDLLDEMCESLKENVLSGNDHELLSEMTEHVSNAYYAYDFKYDETK